MIFLFFSNIFPSSIQIYACRYYTTVSRSIIWWFLAHTIPAKQRALKLSHFCPNTYYRIDDINSNVKSMPIRDGLQNNRQKTPNLNIPFLPNYVWYPYANTGYFYKISIKTCNKALFLMQITKFCLLCKNLFMIR